MNRISFFVLWVALVLATLCGCASAKEMSLAQLQALNNSARIAALENGAERAVTEAELASAIEEFKRGFHASFGPAALAAIGQDVELLAFNQDEMDQRLKPLEDWLWRSKQKVLMEEAVAAARAAGEIIPEAKEKYDVLEDVIPAIRFLPEPNYSDQELNEYLPTARTMLEISQRHYEEGKKSLSKFWLVQKTLGELGGRRKFTILWAKRNSGNAQFLAWLEPLLLPPEIPQESTQAATPK